MTDDRLEAAARRALESLNDLILDSRYPGPEAIAARFELEQALLAQPATVPSAPADRAAVLREAADVVDAMNEGCSRRQPCGACNAREDAADSLRRMADEAPQPETQAEPESLPLLFWDEPAGVVHEDGRITVWLSRAVNLAQSVPAGQLILQADAADRLRRALTTALNDANEEQQTETSHACTEFDTWFDRNICPEPCGAMHQRCEACGAPISGCANDAPAAAVSQPGKEA